MRPCSARRHGSRHFQFDAGHARAEDLEARRLLAAIVVVSSVDSSQIQGLRNLIQDQNGNLFFTANKGTTSPDAGLFELSAGASSPHLLVTFPNQSGDIGALA